MKFLKANLWLLALATLTLPACLQAPEYSDTPVISLNSITATRLDTRLGTRDTVIITLDWRDGDGDLGLDDTDTEPPFNPETSPGVSNPFYNNYFVQFQVRRGSAPFKDTIIGSADSYNGRFFRLGKSERAEALRGTLNRGFAFFQGSFPPATDVRFKIYILDRKLNQSNTITTESFFVKD